MGKEHVATILGDLYRPEEISVTDIKQTTPNVTNITYKFRPYPRTLRQLDHVSSIQMHAALVEGLYCATGMSIRSGYLDFDFDDFLRRQHDMLLRSVKISYREQLQFYEPAKLELQTFQPRMFQGHDIIRTGFEGFMRGNATCVLPR